MAYKCISEEWCSFEGDYRKEFVCDSIDDVANLPQSCTGSTALVRKGGKIYMVGADGEWGIFGEESEAAE